MSYYVNITCLFNIRSYERSEEMVDVLVRIQKWTLFETVILSMKPRVNRSHFRQCLWFSDAALHFAPWRISTKFILVKMDRTYIKLDRVDHARQEVRHRTWKHGTSSQFFNIQHPVQTWDQQQNKTGIINIKLDKNRQRKEPFNYIAF